MGNKENNFKVKNITLLYKNIYSYLNCTNILTSNFIFPSTSKAINNVFIIRTAAKMICE